jgi:DNA-binding transcriptional LysR family regulator
MKTFPKPQNLNGAELIDELAAVGIIVDKVFDFSDGTIGFETDNESTAAAVVAAHNGTTVAPEPTVEDKLASVGLNLEDLRAAILGGN